MKFPSSAKSLQFFRLLAGFPEHLASRVDGQLKGRRVTDIVADKNGRVNATPGNT
jgi:hypothetical protein